MMRACEREVTWQTGIQKDTGAKALSTSSKKVPGDYIDLFEDGTDGVERERGGSLQASILPPPPTPTP